MSALVHKAIKEWLSMLPEPYRSKALHNHTKAPIYGGMHETYSPEGAIAEAFEWYESEEGEQYWHGVFCQVCTGTLILENPEEISLPPAVESLDLYELL